MFERIKFKNLVQNVSAAIRNEAGTFESLTMVVAACAKGWSSVQVVEEMSSDMSTSLKIAHNSECEANHQFTIETFQLDGDDKKNVGKKVNLINDYMTRAVMQIK